MWICTLLWMAASTLCVMAKLRTYELEITMGELDPDCSGITHRVLMVNGQYPAPPIYATLGDEVRVIVRNAISSNAPTTIHYHGILQIGTTESDGMPGVTQAPIQPGDEFEQRFRLIDQSGTYFYHAHVELQDDVIQGPFIVYQSEDDWPESDKQLHDGPFHYDGERTIQLSEWWHQEQGDRLNYYMGNQYNGFIAADSYLVNGRGMTSDSKSSCPGYAALEVEHDKTYRFRVIGGLTFATVGLAIAKHKMTVIEVDGDLIEPFETDYLEVSSGQRFSFLLNTDQEPGTSYNIEVKPFWITNTTTRGRAILKYGRKSHSQGALARGSALDSSQPQFPKEKSQWLFPDMTPLESKELHDFTAPPDRTVVLMPKERLTANNKTRWFINDHPLPHWKVPVIEQLRHRKTRRQLNATAIDLNTHDNWDGYDTSMKTYPIKRNEVVDFVIHTTTLLNQNICAAHPWHSHGLKHFPIAYGAGKYSHEHDRDIRNYQHPIPRDTTLVYPDGKQYTEPGVPCGWTKVRLFAVNPGLWAFHCHITGHMLQGMMIVIEMAPEQISYLQ
ncbi:Cupredoxin [Gongronella butleri]|nr:Cupredoxin [Gongronella butleri]